MTDKNIGLLPKIDAILADPQPDTQKMRELLQASGEVIIQLSSFVAANHKHIEHLTAIIERQKVASVH